MIILDTNVVSETQKAVPDKDVIAFLDGLDPTMTYITSITVAELLYGVDILPVGARKRQLENGVHELIKLFDGNVLPFDLEAASRYAAGAADARGRGVSISFADGQIAGIALSRDLSANNVKVATRDTAPFEAMGVDTIDPWSLS